MEEILLSICIPTYNRVSKVLELVKSILQYKGLNIEVVVLDNASTDETQLKLSEIHDSRLKVFTNSNNIGSMPNIIKSFSHGRGRYLMLCLDKDFIVVDYLDEFLNILCAKSDLSVGTINLNCTVASECNHFLRGSESLLQMAYKSEHPSGLFFKKDIYHNLLLDPQKILVNESFAFNPDLIKADLLTKGNAIFVNIPLVKTEPLEECSEIISFTYLGDNIYFSPKMIQKRVQMFMNHIISLEIKDQIKIKLINLIFTRYLYESTIEFRKILNDSNICNHHKLSTREVKLKELISICLTYNFNFIKHIEIRYFIYIFPTIVISNLKLLIRLFLKVENDKIQ